MSKRYWLKTNAHFFKDSHLVYLKSQKNGYEYIYLWQSLLLKCLEVDDEKDCGFLRLNEKIPYSPELLSEIFNLNIDVVKAGVDLFVNLGMMSILENGTIYIESIQKMIGRESESAERVRLHRERKLLHCNNGVTKSNSILNTNININKEIEDKSGDKSPCPDNNKKTTVKRKLTELQEIKKKELMSRFSAEFKEVTGEALNFDGKEIGAIIKLLNHDDDAIDKRIRRLKTLLPTNPNWYSMTPACLIRDWNKLLTLKVY